MKVFLCWCYPGLPSCPVVIASSPVSDFCLFMSIWMSCSPFTANRWSYLALGAPCVCHSPWFYLTLALVLCNQLVRRAVHSSFDRYLVVFACFLHLPLPAYWPHFQVASFLTSSWAPSRTCTPPILQSFTPKFAKSVCLSSVFSFIVVFFCLWNFQQLPLSSS